MHKIAESKGANPAQLIEVVPDRALLTTIEAPGCTTLVFSIYNFDLFPQDRRNLNGSLGRAFVLAQADRTRVRASLGTT
jgi:hypothetical protein